MDTSHKERANKLFFQKHKNEVEHEESGNRFDVLACSTETEDKIEEEIEANNNRTEEIKEKSMLTDDKVKKSDKNMKRKEKMEKKTKIRKKSK